MQYKYKKELFYAQSPTVPILRVIDPFDNIIKMSAVT